MYIYIYIGRSIDDLRFNLLFVCLDRYIIPFIAISGVDKPHYTTWEDGSYTAIAQAIGGVWLCTWVLISNFFGNLGLYVAEMTKDAFQLAGMADSDLAPAFFSV
jgi:hypothetical protein